MSHFCWRSHNNCTCHRINYWQFTEWSINEPMSNRTSRFSLLKKITWKSITWWSNISSNQLLTIIQKNYFSPIQHPTLAGTIAQRMKMSLKEQNHLLTFRDNHTSNTYIRISMCHQILKLFPQKDHATIWFLIESATPTLELTLIRTITHSSYTTKYLLSLSLQSHKSRILTTQTNTVNTQARPNLPNHPTKNQSVCII